MQAGTPQSHQDDNPAATSTIVEDFEFSELKYVKSSRMNKRWLVFSCKIEVCGSTLCPGAACYALGLPHIPEQV